MTPASRAASESVSSLAGLRKYDWLAASTPNVDSPRYTVLR